MTHRIRVDHVVGTHFDVGIRGHQLSVDQPHATGGLEAGPTPTELFVAALASCVAHFAQSTLIRDQPNASIRVGCDFQMSENPPWHVALIELDVRLPAGLTAERRASIERATDHCIVNESLQRPPRIAITFSEQPDAILVPGMAPVNADAATILRSRQTR